eukprot:CAMPEP_0169065418 /NCGR_PEP_ID=MMETSP1015-20121227/2392_1 /TAXON_ID=342587 /ORGANISM="Karlodinium micrum, Strain CCMP2283" /LENGTH=158 /DNA_ID=CAMNT_0009123989 /DNA_START=42 /DNA_END=518 /DNA_ORIENTATION=-
MGGSACKAAPCCVVKDKDGDTLFNGDDEPKLIESDSLSLPGAVSSTSPAKPPRKQDEEYSIVIDKGDGAVKLGIDVDYVAESESLPIRTILSGGLVEMWNTAHPDTRVDECDHIVEVNGERQVVDLLIERLQADSTLKITLRRLATRHDVGRSDSKPG